VLLLQLKALLSIKGAGVVCILQFGSILRDAVCKLQKWGRRGRDERVYRPLLINSYRKKQLALQF
jgi:hypothetical protein